MKITVRQENEQFLKETYPRANHIEKSRILNDWMKSEGMRTSRNFKRYREDEEFLESNNYKHKYNMIYDNLEMKAEYENKKVCSGMFVGNNDASLFVWLGWGRWFYCGIITNKRITDFMDYEGLIAIKNGGFISPVDDSVTYVPPNTYQIFSYEGIDGKILALHPHAK